MACARYPEPRELRHRHPRRDGTLVTLRCTPLGADTYRVTPFPFDADEVTVAFPYRRLPTNGFTTQDEFRACFAAAPVESPPVRIVR